MLLRFVDTPQQRAPKRTPVLRRRDFSEIFDEFRPDKAAEQASRCSQCGVPFCQIHCPLHNNIPDWLQLTAEGRLREAYEIAALTNTFPEICGRICPQDRLCEGNCVIEKGFDSVTIGMIERHVTETAFEEGWIHPPRPRIERDQSVAIVGAGPAGLAAADQLRRQGYRVTIYDRHDRAGGLLTYGIPNFKLDKKVVSRRIELLDAGGIEFRVNTEIGRDLSFNELQERYDAVLIATGVYSARELVAPGSGLPGVYPALDYLTTSNRRGLGDDVGDFPDLNASGKDVIVVGGGDTAMDCVRTAVRQDARSVTCLYRRDRPNMPGSQREVNYALEEGVVFEFLSAPDAFQGDTRVEGVRASRMRLSEPDTGGRLRPVPVDGSGYQLEATMVLKALGFDPEPVAEMFELQDLETDEDGTISVDPETGITGIPGVFAAGDIVRGASLVVWAIRDGRNAATSIHRYLRQRTRLS